MLAVSRAGAMSEYTITIDKDCVQTAGPAVPFTWTCTPLDSMVATDLSRGGHISIDTAGCVPVVKMAGSPAVTVAPVGNVTCILSSGGTSTRQTIGTISGASVFFGDPDAPPDTCIYLDFDLTIQCSS